MSAAKIIILIFLVALVGILQQTGLLNIFGIKPNLLLVFLTAVSFFVTSFPIFLILLVVAIIFLKFSIAFQVELAIFAVLMIAVFFLSQRLQWKPVFSNSLMIIMGTIGFYLAVSPEFLIGDWKLVLGEIIYNLILGTLMFKVFERWLTTSSILKI